MKYDYVVVGAGFAGAVTAERLTAAGRKVLVVDKRDHIGGNAYDEYDETGVLIHRYGPHIFNTSSHEVVAYLSRFTEWRAYEHRVLAATPKGLLPVPINATTIEGFFDVELKTEEAVREFLDRKRVPSSDPQTVESVVIDQVGPELYEAFFRGYTEKQWGRHPSLLHRSVVGRLAARTDRDDRYFKSTFQAIPVDGYTAMFERILRNVEVKLELPLTAAEARSLGRHVIWTGPLDEAYDCRYGRLPWRSLYFEELRFESSALVLPVAVVNYPDPGVPWTRITEYRHLTGQQARMTTVHKEFPTAQGEPYYPVPSPESKALVSRYEHLAAREVGMSFVGRLATYRYLTMHQVIGQALRMTRRLLRERSPLRSTLAAGNSARLPPSALLEQ